MSTNTTRFTKGFILGFIISVTTALLIRHWRLTACVVTFFWVLTLGGTWPVLAWLAGVIVLYRAT